MASPHRPPCLRFELHGPVSPEDIAGLAEGLGQLLEHRAGTVAVCDVSGAGADAVTVDALARLQLAAMRCGCRMVIHGASTELRDLLEFMGLQEVLPSSVRLVESSSRCRFREP